MIVVTLEDYLPSPRYDSVPWTKALIDEAPTSAGPWTQIDQIIFADPDADPTDPKARNLTTPNGTLEFGWYRVTFTDQFGETAQPTAPKYNGPSQSYEPTIDQVARKLLSRTVDQYGNMTGAFTSDTTPTAAQVQAIIEGVMPQVADVIGDEIPDALTDDAANVVAILAATQIELDFFSEQVNTGRSIYPQLVKQYDAALAALQRAVTSALEGGGTVVDEGPTNVPSYSFPNPCHSLGLRTRW